MEAPASKQQGASLEVEDEKLGQQMVKERLISDSQLNTASDFQRAIGGRLEDLIVRLGFVDPLSMEKFMLKSGTPSRIEKPVIRKETSSGNKGKGDINEKTGNLTRPAFLDAETPAVLAELDISVPQPSPGRQAARDAREGRDARDGRDGRESREGKESREIKEAARQAAMNETSIVLDALLRILVRKGIIESNEIKEEIRRI